MSGAGCTAPDNRCCFDVYGVEDSPGEGRRMNIGTIGVALVVLGFAVYVYIGIKRGWIK